LAPAEIEKFLALFLIINGLYQFLPSGTKIAHNVPAGKYT